MAGQADAPAGSLTVVPRTIVAVRVIAIFFMMYVHSWAGEVRFPDQAFTGPFRLFAALLVDVMGRTSVPLLTIISGYLLYTVSGARNDHGALVAGKFRTLLVPMWLWNGLLLILVWASVQFRGAPVPAFVVEPGPVNAIFGLTDQPATLPLTFLRDMFVCALLSPALVWLVRRALWPTLLAGFLFAIFKPEQVVILRHQLLFFYLVGLAFAMHWRVPRTPRFGWAGLLALLVVAGWFIVWDGPLAGRFDWYEPGRQVLANGARLGVAWLMWNLCLWVQGTAAYSPLARTEPVIFITFCSHFLLFRSLGAVLPDTPALMPILFLLQPPLAIAAAFGIVFGLGRVSPWLLRLVNGGRVPKPRF
jgi:hypothetical protein